MVFGIFGAFFDCLLQSGSQGLPVDLTVHLSQELSERTHTPALFLRCVLVRRYGISRLRVNVLFPKVVIVPLLKVLILPFASF